MFNVFKRLLIKSENICEFMGIVDHLVSGMGKNMLNLDMVGSVCLHPHYNVKYRLAKYKYIQLGRVVLCVIITFSHSINYSIIFIQKCIVDI